MKLRHISMMLEGLGSSAYTMSSGLFKTLSRRGKLEGIKNDHGQPLRGVWRYITDPYTRIQVGSIYSRAATINEIRMNKEMQELKQLFLELKERRKAREG